MTISIERPTVEDLHARRAEILRQFDLSMDEFAELARTYMLTDSEREAWEDLCAIGYLLGDE